MDNDDSGNGMEQGRVPPHTYTERQNGELKAEIDWLIANDEGSRPLDPALRKIYHGESVALGVYLVSRARVGLRHVLSHLHSVLADVSHPSAGLIAVTLARICRAEGIAYDRGHPDRAILPLIMHLMQLDHDSGVKWPHGAHERSSVRLVQACGVTLGELRALLCSLFDRDSEECSKELARAIANSISQPRCCMQHPFRHVVDWAQT